MSIARSRSASLLVWTESDPAAPGSSDVIARLLSSFDDLAVRSQPSVLSRAATYQSELRIANGPHAMAVWRESDGQPQIMASLIGSQPIVLAAGGDRDRHRPVASYGNGTHLVAAMTRRESRGRRRVRTRRPIGDGKEATEANLKLPQDAAIDDAGNIYIADTTNHRVRRVDATSGVITTIAGGGTGGFRDNEPAILTELVSPTTIAVDRARRAESRRLRALGPS